LVGADEIGRYLGVKRASVLALIMGLAHEHLPPMPAHRTSRGVLFARRDALDWWSATGEELDEVLDMQNRQATDASP